MKKTLSFLSIPFLAAPLFAQTATPTPAPTPASAAKPATPAPIPPLFWVGGFRFSGALRTRFENFDWFETSGFDDDSFFNGTQLRLNGLKSTPKTDIAIDLQQTLLFGLPETAIVPAPRGLLGLGANYFQANGNQDGALSVKQAFVRFKNAFGTGSSARVGRFEWNEGIEIPAKNPTLNWLKTQRVSQRLVGTFGFTHTGRAFDGAQISLPLSGGANFTGMAARPTVGVFELEANDNVDSVNFLYGAYSLPMKNADARVFGLVYQDGRAAPKSVKTDNRPLVARQADSEEIRLYTLGANYAQTFETAGGTFDVLGWGALQGGDWGALDHKGNALALEAGFQPKNSKLKPWIRAGYYRSSGDGNNADGTHKTFFTPLPTPRLYARYPFYNQMNNTDVFVETILRPTPKLNVRASFHKLKLSQGSDLWYAGGGAFSDEGFGYAGRPSGGDQSLANLLDISFDYAINPTTSLGFYVARASGKDVIENIYADKKSTYAFLEFSKRF